MQCANDKSELVFFFIQKKLGTLNLKRRLKLDAYAICGSQITVKKSNWDLCGWKFKNRQKVEKSAERTLGHCEFLKKINKRTKHI